MFIRLNRYIKEILVEKRFASCESVANLISIKWQIKLFVKNKIVILNLICFILKKMLCIFFSESRDDGPVISGGKKEYQVGEIVDVNCTASKSQPPAELQWYINDKEVINKY